jgi:OmpA-OmpF porin, OOP family
MTVKIQNKPRLIVFLAIMLAVVYYGVGERFGLPLPGKQYFKSQVIDGGELSTLAPISTPSEAKELPLPSWDPTNKGVRVKKLDMAWNSQLSEHYANGGPQTTRGSLMEKYGVNMTIERQDDTGKMREESLKFAKAFKDAGMTGNPQVGTHFFSIMGSGVAAMMASLQPEMEKLGLHPEVIAGSGGKSDGEDGYWGPAPWKTNPQLARGGLCAVFPLDGDQDLVFLWCKINQIPINTDSRYFDENALNFMEVKDFVVAGEKYITGATETRPEIKDGKPTGRQITKTVNSYASWTPVDVSVATKKGGVVPLATTREYPWQMPNVIIGVREWDMQNSKVVEGMLSAMFEGSDQIRKYPKAMRRAAEVSCKIYNAETPEYWESYAKGKIVRDVQGNDVRCGGSASFNLAENLYMFGLLPEQRTNQYALTYTTFGNFQKLAYPNQLKSYPKFEDVINMSYLNAIASRNQAAATLGSATEVETFTKQGEINEGNVIARGNWHINFRSGSADFTPEAQNTLRELLGAISVSNQYLDIVGHTDNVGNDASNMTLGQRRAEAVKQWLVARAPGIFGAQRVNASSKGASQPVASNETKEGQAQNRRVEIILGSK